MSDITVVCPKCGKEQKLLFPSQIAWCSATLACRKSGGPMVPKEKV